MQEAPGRRKKVVVRIFRIDPALDRVPPRLDEIARIEVEPFAARDADLPTHQIDAGHHFGDWVLDLQAGVHFEEVELAVLVEQEFDGAGVGVADAARDGRGRRGDGLSQRRGHGRRRRLFDHFLMATLDRALALDERHDRSVLVAEQLHFDVTRPVELPLEIHRGVAKRRGGLRARATNGARQLGGIGDGAHAFPAATSDGLDE